MTQKSETKEARAVNEAARAFRLLVAGTVATLLCVASPALAGPPSHMSKPELSLDSSSEPVKETPGGEFDQACGTAIDSEGDLYVASAGKSYIDVFRPSGNPEDPWDYLTSIENTNGPCGLAVDSKGNLYASESTTGNVVRYEPNEYPFAGTPNYTEVTPPIDESGEAKGISIDIFDDRLYVAKGARIDVYDSDGSLGIDEVQRVNCFECTGGTYKLKFGASEWSTSIAFEGPATEVEEALEDLSTIGPGNVSVSGEGKIHSVTFTGELAHADVEMLVGDSSDLIGGESKAVLVTEQVKGFNGHIGEGNLTSSTGIAAYTYRVNSEKADRYLFIADDAADEVRVLGGPEIRSLKLRKTIAGSKPGEDFGFGTAGAYLAVDPGNGSVATGKCALVAEQACTSGHFLVYDEVQKAVAEFDASGEFLDRFTAPAFADAKPTALAVDRSGGTADGTIYISAGAGPGSSILAFAPLASPSRPPLPELSRVLANSGTVATDSEGNVYVGAGTTIYVYGPDGSELTKFNTPRAAHDLNVDSTGKVYMRFGDLGGEYGDQEVVYYAPSFYPPGKGTTYTGPILVATGNTFATPTFVTAIGIDPSSDHLFVGGYNGEMFELASAAEGSSILDSCFTCSLSLPSAQGIGVYGANSNVYLSGSSGGTVFVIDPNEPGEVVVDDEEIVARITGAGSPKGSFSGSTGKITVDQSNGHVLVFNQARGAEEYDASGAFVADFGKFTNIVRPSGIAIDNSGGSADGNVYVAFDDTAPESYDLTAFGPLTYGEQPIAVTGIAGGLGGGETTLNGTVDPRGFELEDCNFDYLTDAEYEQNIEEAEVEGHEEAASEGYGFEGAEQISCVESQVEIGKGIGPVAVHAGIGGLDPEVRYRFRLIATNKYGKGEGKAGLFGPPVLTPKNALPVLYDEAILRAEVDPSGLGTQYRFEYGPAEAYGQSTPAAEVAPGDGGVAIQALLTGLDEGTEYHFRIVAENEAMSVEGPDQTLVTLERAKQQNCLNTEYRIGLSARLPDCRAYELVTPAETRGSIPRAAGPGTAGQEFNNWLVAPRGEGAGERIVYFALTLPGFEGIGKTDAYRAQRAAGAHPATGWANELFGPTYVQAGGEAQQHGVASDQRYGFFSLGGATSILERGQYLRTPSGFEPIAKGSLGTDLEAVSMGTRGPFVSAGGGHVVFSSDKHLEPEAAPEGTEVVYDRAAGASGAEVISVKPDGGAFGTGENAAYIAASEDGPAVVFSVGGTLYLHRKGTATEIATAPNSFAGVSEDGKRVFYTGVANGSSPGVLFACDVEVGPCVGAEPSGRTKIASNSIFVNVSPDGSRILFSSEEAFTGAEENEAGESAETGNPNLYAWDGAKASFVAVLDDKDFESFDGYTPMNLRRWTGAVSAGLDIGRGNSPTRSTPGGDVFVFQSHARLTPYDNEGRGEIYRYEPASPTGKQLICVSCDPTGTPPSADALLQVNSFGGVTTGTTLIPNITDDGETVSFQSPDRLLPEDANSVVDVYEWQAQGAENCERPGGCLALISSGQGEEPSYLYGMTADGHDVFFETPEKLVGADVPGSPSIYDARIGGGIPDPPTKAPCQGDACKPQASPPSPLPVAGTETRASHAGSGSCAKLARAAKRHSTRAKRLRRSARRAGGKAQAQRTRQRATRQAEYAKRLSRKATRCKQRARKAAR